jgi:hypothetical protein
MKRGVRAARWNTVVQPCRADASPRSHHDCAPVHLVPTKLGSSLNSEVLVAVVLVYMVRYRVTCRPSTYKRATCCALLPE